MGRGAPRHLPAGMLGYALMSTMDALVSGSLRKVDVGSGNRALIGLVVHPTLPRLLFVIDPVVDEIPKEERLTADVDLDRIRRLCRIVLQPSAAANQLASGNFHSEQ
ncbi:hypothetical protein [Actinoallomurus iriomotensis]|uniref:Uncharacterized protein n=1 Tax=Actinoallomurus iriomotensis TaxID=478107 RepID=A0A9W6S437_9ACTN|nr:hypothetical protein [Actinoallomurus iriomotensis]GLY86823.1 hypothetical protein Airi02_047520 [Actinoallomurus iriomotensis]